MKFCLLGDLEVWEAGLRLPPLRPRQQRFLARLLLSPHTLVSIGALAETLWDGDPPASAERQVQNTASQLRQVWLGAGVTEARQVLRTARAGYVLDIDRDQIDLYQFRGMVADAAAIIETGELRGAARTLRQALALWRAPAFASVDSRFIREHALLLDEERPAAWEDCMRLELQAGLHGRVIAEMAALVAEFPFREQLTGLLMVALYRSGRQSDALITYQKTRALLSTELGIDPGPELRQLHQRILHSDLTLLGPAVHETMAVAHPAAPVDPYPRIPRQIPPADGHFTGRGKELEAVVGHCGQAQVIVIVGGAGMGKTSLAVQAAHQVGDRFPDGHLFLDLGAHSAATNRPPTGVLAHLLESLNLPANTIPGALEKQIALYRSITADKKLLIVLDNAGSIEQVLPAVPTAGGSQLIVTSRNTQAALHAHVAVKMIALDGLSRPVSRTLLTEAAGLAPQASSPALESLLDLCGGMPLALRILAARLLSESALTIEELATGLPHHNASLDGFTIDGDARSVRSVLANVYAALSPEEARLLRLLAVHPGRRIRREAAAALAAVPLPRAQAAANSLIALHLLADGGDGYLTMHDLIRSYAAERLAEEPASRQEAACRLLAWYLALAARANGVLRPDRDAFGPPAAGTNPFVQPFTKDIEAIKFFNAERDNLAPVVLLAVRHRIEGAVELVYYLHSYFIRSGFPNAIVAAWRECEQQSGRIGEPRLLAHLHHALGGALGVTNEPEAALDSLYLSAVLYERAGDLAGAAGARLGIGAGLDAQGKYQDALEETEGALNLARAARNTTLEVHALNNSADILVALGGSDAALRRLEAGRELARDGGLRHHEAAILSSVGALFLRHGEYAKALEYLHEGLALMRRSGFRTAEATTLSRVGHAVLGSGDRDGAADWFRKAQEVYRQNNDVAGEAAMTRLMGEFAADRLSRTASR
ncbi:AfsR/SARP family transcriptional regulator [Micromonospora schwarzwaldensis]|uniref:AfsR/SARP family transcriptional regulator n=1 Tax=Micromonospora sp. DSM 45708 TaxID=3111767 RepID=UPI0031E0DDBC